MWFPYPGRPSASDTHYPPLSIVVVPPRGCNNPGDFDFSHPIQKAAMSIKRFLAFLVLLLSWGSLELVALLSAGAEQPYSPPVARASNEAAFGLKRIQVPKGMLISVFAAEPMLANRVCFCIDERNRFYVAETFRIHHGVEDNRDHLSWLDDDLASRTVADRVAMYRKHLGAGAAAYGVEHERVRLIEDLDGDGKADRSTVFADGFHQIP